VGAIGDGQTDDTAAFQRMLTPPMMRLLESYRTYTFLKAVTDQWTVTLDPKPVPPVPFGIQVAPLFSAGHGKCHEPTSVIGTTFIKKNDRPMFVIAAVMTRP